MSGVSCSLDHNRIIVKLPEDDIYKSRDNFCKTQGHECLDIEDFENFWNRSFQVDIVNALTNNLIGRELVQRYCVRRHFLISSFFRIISFEVNDNLEFTINVVQRHRTPSPTAHPLLRNALSENDFEDNSEVCEEESNDEYTLEV
jgi:hypothetical protein